MMLGARRGERQRQIRDTRERKKERDNEYKDAYDRGDESENRKKHKMGINWLKVYGREENNRQVSMTFRRRRRRSARRDYSRHL